MVPMKLQTLYQFNAYMDGSKLSFQGNDPLEWCKVKFSGNGTFEGCIVKIFKVMF